MLTAEGLVVTAFGTFVGVHQDGLVHLSKKLSDQFVKDRRVFFCRASLSCGG
ncbi:MAG TPA: hypothetical protein VJT73_03005 [Polyangiaceae bacterium]|nr:hypothetical protein [Polyangiaceae bacterium]